MVLNEGSFLVMVSKKDKIWFDLLPRKRQKMTVCVYIGILKTLGNIDIIFCKRLLKTFSASSNLLLPILCATLMDSQGMGVRENGKKEKTYGKEIIQELWL
jgi:hypothetical protein